MGEAISEGPAANYCRTAGREEDRHASGQTNRRDVQEGRAVQGGGRQAAGAGGKGEMKDFKAAFESMSMTSILAAEMIKPFSEISQKASRILSEGLKPLLDSLQKLSIEVGGHWRKAFEQYGIDERVATKLLEKYKLFLSPSIDIRLVSEIARIGRKTGIHRAEINRLLETYFGSNNFMELERIMKQWGKNELFRPRMKIIQDCLVTLRNKKKGYNPSNVVLPALIAQIDGIRQCYMEKKGYFYKKVNGQICLMDSNGQVMVDSNGQNMGWKEVYKLTTAESRDMASACEIFVDILYESSKRGKPTLITFNRHKIQHGENVRYGRLDNTIRAFLTLDFLCHLK
jgi:hypothetical protein